MTLPLRPLSYPHRPVGHLAGLSAALRIPLGELQRIAAIADTQYREAKPIVKPDGSLRQPYDALPVLKNIQRRIQAQFLAPVIFPAYLTGSIKGRDARRNAELHVGTAIVVCEDVESFFPNTTAQSVRSIWIGFFGFAPDVADLLTILTTKEGCLPQFKGDGGN